MLISTTQWPTRVQMYDELRTLLRTLPDGQMTARVLELTPSRQSKRKTASLCKSGVGLAHTSTLGPSADLNEPLDNAAIF
ncbi:hypothetical protein O181_015873 [Austropuccinia psidii MF-1]|uniref:Uncharacterized protein n=1 Tax=Austropuccinia psidii MF-1 TaxID=1389203 RepID=A0A9Q3C416_9BASI|nr:hypothetical protein [Austropuccinia psidii MF-1]